jgi:hypothetical protein
MLLNELQRLETAHARELQELRAEFERRFVALESRSGHDALPAAVDSSDG